MATATARIVPVEKTVTVTEYEKDGSVELTLTKEEAETLSELLYKVGGSPYVSRRGHMQNLANALREAGVLNPANAPYTSDLIPTSEGSIHFSALPEGNPALKGLKADPAKDILREVYGSSGTRRSFY